MALKLNKQFFQNMKSVRTMQVRKDHHHVSLAKQCKDIGLHADNLPVAKPNFQAWRAERQKNFNVGLIVGTAILAVGIFGPISAGWWSFAVAPSYDKVRKDFPGAKFADAK